MFLELQIRKKKPFLEMIRSKEYSEPYLKKKITKSVHILSVLRYLLYFRHSSWHVKGQNLSECFTQTCNTYIAHNILRLPEEIRNAFGNVNELISNTENVFLKAPFRVQFYRVEYTLTEQLPSLPFPLWSETTRCGWKQCFSTTSTALL